MRDLAALGFEPREALRRLLARYDLPPAAFSGGGPATAHDLAAELESRDLGARMVDGEAADVRYLEPPALLSTTAGTWLLMHRRGVRGGSVETARGTVNATWSELAAASSGSAIEIVPRLARDRSIFTAMLQVLGRTPGVIPAAALTLLFHLLAVVTPLLTKMTIDRALPERAVSLLHLIALAVVLTAGFRFLAAWLRGQAIVYLQTRLENVVERGFFDHVMRLPFPFLQKRTIGDVLQSFDGLRTARELLTERALATILDVVPSLVYVAFMAAFMPAATVVVLSAATLVLVTAFAVGRRQVTVQRRELEAQRGQRLLLVEMLTGISTVKSSGVETAMARSWMERLRRELRLGLQRQRLRLWIDVGGELLQDLVLAFVLIYGAGRVVAGELTAGSLVAVLQMAAALGAAVTTFATEYLALVAAKPQLEKASELLSAPPEPRPPAVRRGRTELRAPVAVDDLWFRYAEDGPWIFRGFDMRVEVGEKRRIVGPSGFGKTTLLRVLAGIYLPQQGTVRIGTMPAVASSPLVMYLPQFPTLFTGSILDNLKVISGTPDRNRIFEAAAATGLDEWLQTLPMGYDTLVAAGGASLSGGQRQLVAITAVAASERPLLLLDEPMANLDGAMQQRVIHCEMFRNRTVIYAAHAEPWDELTA